MHKCLFTGHGKIFIKVGALYRRPHHCGAFYIGVIFSITRNNTQAVLIVKWIYTSTFKRNT